MSVPPPFAPLLYLSTRIPSSLYLPFASRLSKTLTLDHPPNLSSILLPGSGEANLYPAESDPFENKKPQRDVHSECRKPDIVSLEYVGPSCPNQVDVGMGEGKERGAMTVCEEDDDEAVKCVSEDGTTAGCGVTTNSQDEDWNKEGEGTVVCSISSSGFFAFCNFLVSWRFLGLAFFSSSLILLLFFCFFFL